MVPKEPGRVWSAPDAGYTFIALVFLCWNPLAASGQATLEGTIRQAGTGAPLAGVQVSVPALGLGGITDPGGHYEVGDIPAGTHTVDITRIGFATETREVTLADGQVMRLDLELHETALAIEGLVAVGSRARPRTVTQSAVPIRRDRIAGLH